MERGGLFRLQRGGRGGAERRGATANFGPAVGKGQRDLGMGQGAKMSMA